MSQLFLFRSPLCPILHHAYLAIGIAVFSIPATAFAQKAPEVGYVFPASVPAGATTDVVLGGYDWTPDVQLFTSDPRVQLTLLGPPGDALVPPPPYWFGPKAMQAGTPIPRETPVRVTVAPGTPSGPVLWRVANANGGSPHAVLWITATPDERENERLRGPQDLPALPIGVTGRIDRIEDVDRYRIRPERDGPITVELQARRLGANYHGQLTVHDAAGQILADVADTQGRDAAVTFAGKAGEEYVVSLHDIDFRGDWAYIYRLQFTPGPRVVAALPTVGQRGATGDVRFIGWGLATGANALEELTRPVAFPGDAGLAAFDYVLETPGGTAVPFRMLLDDLPVSLEPADAAPESRRLAVPTAVTGTLTDRNGVDRYTLDAKQGDVYVIAATARRLGLPLDVTLAILGPDGMELARNDDLPGTTDAALTFTVPADGAYQVVIGDQSGQSGKPTAVYHLTV
jgi:hypothetical protein